MPKGIRIPSALWSEIMRVITDRLSRGKLDKPIVFALYTKEHDHHEITAYREIPTVEVKGDYPDGEYDYKYPGIKKLDFYPNKGAGKWFSGTLVVGDGLELGDSDKNWMVREAVDFRIKMDKDPERKLAWRAYYIDFPVVPFETI